MLEWCRPSVSAGYKAIGDFPHFCVNISVIDDPFDGDLMVFCTKIQISKKIWKIREDEKILRRSNIVKGDTSSCPAKSLIVSTSAEYQCGQCGHSFNLAYQEKWLCSCSKVLQGVFKALFEYKKHTAKAEKLDWKKDPK